MKGFLLTAIFVVLVLSSTAFAQDVAFGYENFNFGFCGGGARAEGMGKAFLGVSDDVTGASWNPAGLYTIEKPVLGVSWGSLAPRGTSNWPYATVSTSYEHTGSFDAVSSFTFAAPIRIKGHPFVGSLAYVRNCDMFEESQFVTSDWFQVGTGGALYFAYGDLETSTRLEGGMNSVNFAFGTRFYESVSFGVGLNIYTGKTLRETSRYFYFPELWTDDFMQTGVGEQYLTDLDTLKFSGANFTVGFKHSGEKMGAGLVVRTPFAMKVEFDHIQYRIGYLNGLTMDDATDTLYFMDNLVKYDIPWIIGFGVSYQATENLLVAADMEYQAYSGGVVQVRESVLLNPGGDNIENFIEYDPQWENVFALRVGAEYLKEFGFGIVPLRAGMGMTPSMWPNYDALFETSKATAYHGSLGTGIHWEQIRFDIAYTLSTIDRQFGPTVDYTNRNHHLNVSFTGVF